MKSDQLRDWVTESLRSARENGFYMSPSLSENDIERIRADVGTFGTGLEGADPDEIAEHVKAFFRRTGQYRD